MRSFNIISELGLYLVKKKLVIPRFCSSMAVWSQPMQSIISSKQFYVGDYVRSKAKKRTKQEHFHAEM